MITCGEYCQPFCMNCANQDSRFCFIKRNPVSDNDICDYFICMGIVKDEV